MQDKKISVRLSEPFYEYIEMRAGASKITISEYIRLLIVLDKDKEKNQPEKSLALEEVNEQIQEMQKLMSELQALKKQLTSP